MGIPDEALASVGKHQLVHSGCSFKVIVLQDLHSTLLGLINMLSIIQMLIIAFQDDLEYSISPGEM